MTDCSNRYGTLSYFVRSLFYFPLQIATRKNIITVKEGNEENEAVLALIEILKSDTIKTFIEETYEGAVVPLF